MYSFCIFSPWAQSWDRLSSQPWRYWRTSSPFLLIPLQSYRNSETSWWLAHKAPINWPLRKYQPFWYPLCSAFCYLKYPDCQSPTFIFQDQTLTSSKIPTNHPLKCFALPVYDLSSDQISQTWNLPSLKSLPSYYQKNHLNPIHSDYSTLLFRYDHFKHLTTSSPMILADFSSLTYSSVLT